MDKIIKTLLVVSFVLAIAYTGYALFQFVPFLIGGGSLSLGDIPLLLFYWPTGIVLTVVNVINNTEAVIDNWTVAFLLIYITTVVFTIIYARTKNKSVFDWAMLSILFPFAAFLVFSAKGMDGESRIIASLRELSVLSGERKRKKYTELGVSFALWFFVMAGLITNPSGVVTGNGFEVRYVDYLSMRPFIIIAGLALALFLTVRIFVLLFRPSSELDQSILSGQRR